MNTNVKPLPKEAPSIKTWTLERDGLMPGHLPAYRVVTVTVQGKETKVERSKQFLLFEAQAIIEDNLRLAVNV